MIFVDRSTVKPPAFLHSPRAQRAIAQLRDFLAHARPGRSQKKVPIDFGVFRTREVQATLMQLFQKKCAFCESAVSEGVVDHFRPFSLFPERAYDWDNLYWACKDCSMNKGAQFPQDPDGTPLLVDPCVDRPEEVLRFQDDGRIDGSGGDPWNQARGKTTIEVLGLNRSLLVNRRRDLGRALGTSWDAVFHYPVSEKDRHAACAALDDALSASRPYAGAARAMTAARTLKYRETAMDPRTREHFAAVAKAVQLDVEALLSSVAAPRAATLVQAPAPPLEQLGAAYLSRVVIEHFKSIRRVELEPVAAPAAGGESPAGSSTALSGADDEETSDAGPEQKSSVAREQRAPWRMILGENGAGKSSILRAIALALTWTDLSKDRRREAMATARSRHAAKSSRTRILVELSTGQTVELTFGRGEPRPRVKNASDKQPFVLAYGPYRRLPQVSEAPQKHDRFLSLFDSRRSLIDAEGWLMNLKDERIFDLAAASLKVLLRLDADDLLVRTEGKVVVRRRAGTAAEWDTPITEMSDGYQCVIALAVDIMASAQSYAGNDFGDVQGIVLIDEIDAHLHPTWRMQIVRDLRETFPRLQFIVSTHEPLCLRGLDRGEVVVLRRDEPGGPITQVPAQEVPDPSAMRVDQLLTSGLFGLHTTIDPEIDRLFALYYALLGKRARTPEQEEQLAKVRKRVRDHGVLGYTRRDQLVYEAIDVLLARRPAEQRKLRPKTLERVADIWEFVEAEGDA